MSEELKDVVISYETLYELLRREKNRSEIQKLPDGFIEDTGEYVKKLRHSLGMKRRDVSSFSGDDVRKEEQKLDSVQKVIAELYEKREKKIISMAIARSRTKASLADVASLLDSEKRLFQLLVETLDQNRNSILGELFGELKAQQASSTIQKPADVPKASDFESNTTAKAPVEPSVQRAEPSTLNMEQSIPKAEAVTPKVEPSAQKVEQNASEAQVSSINSTSNPVSASETQKSTIPEGKRRVVFLAPIPKFVDRDMNVLGPFEEGEEALLPLDIATILSSKNKINIIE